MHVFSQSVSWIDYSIGPKETEVSEDTFSVYDSPVTNSNIIAHRRIMPDGALEIHLQLSAGNRVRGNDASGQYHGSLADRGL